MKMAERHAEIFGHERPPLPRDQQTLQADPAFAQWLDELINESKRTENDDADSRKF